LINSRINKSNTCSELMNYSLINHHFHQSTITIKPKINVNKLGTELH